MPRFAPSLLPLLLAAALAAPPAWAGDDHPPPTEAQLKELEKARKELEKARVDLERAAKQLARASGEVGKFSPRAFAYEFMANPKRGMMGVIIDKGPDKDGEIRGLLVQAVTPGGGADKAGIKPGDVIVTANGRSLIVKKGNMDPASKEHKEWQGPFELLKEAMGELQVGQAVKIEYERDGKRNAATVVAQRPEPVSLALMPDIELIDDKDPEHEKLWPMPGPLPFGPYGNPLPELQLASLDEDLAPYFKTREGVLVVKPPKGGALGLKGGDVIQKINGKTIGDAREALERLHGAKPGTRVTIDVVRQGVSQKLEGAVPERTSLLWEKRVRIVVEDD